MAKSATKKTATKKTASNKPATGKTATGEAATGDAGAERSDPHGRIIDAALTLAAERGWRALSLGEIAAAAELPLSRVYPVFPSKQAILEGLSRKVDAEVLAEDVAEDGGSARDRLFDVLMRRFDALAPYKAGIANIVLDLARDPLSAALATPQLLRSMALMLELARIRSSGLAGLVRTQGLASIYLATVRVWLRDDSADMARTMAALDGRLRRVESVIQRLPGRTRRRGEREG